MPKILAGDSVSFRFRVVDIRELDAAPFLESGSPEANVIAILMRLSDERAAVRRILQRIAENEPGQREIALREFFILAGLRRLGAIIEQETKTMPILDDIMDHDVLGPLLRRGLEQGRVVGRSEGRVEGERIVVIRQIEKRFGRIPASARQQLQAMSAAEIEDTALRLLEAQSVEDLFGK